MDAMTGEVLESGRLRLFVDTCTANRKGHNVRLGAIECRMLATLMRANGAPVSVDLCELLWGVAGACTVARVRGVAKRLRLKLRGVRIETLVREGYRLAVDCRAQKTGPELKLAVGPR
jgi:DNA-binding response OmpR family regulator